MTYYDLTANLFLQIAIIILACRIVVYIGKRYFNQTEVVSEMVTGIILGPSIFGYFFPYLQQSIFPTAPLTLSDGSMMPNPSMLLLFAISQLGVVIYMFLTGLEFTTKTIRKHGKSVAFLCLLGMLIPFIVGVIFFYCIQTEGLFEPTASKGVAMIFFGAAISITAFPVLVRIMDEKHIIKTPLGVLTLATGSLEDAAAWCLVALVLTITKHDPHIVVLMISGTILYVMIMILFGQLLRRRFSHHFHHDIKPSKHCISFILIVLLLCAVTVDKIGLYSAFGAFVAGAVLPKGQFAQRLKNKFSYFTTTFLLPIFFAYTGLNTKISLINTPTLWLITIAIIVIAIISKLVTCSLAARYLGVAWKESLAYGVLMNTRGLMELVILNIGLQFKIISLTLYTMMVIMTVVTTLITSPLITRILGDYYKHHTLSDKELI